MSTKYQENSSINVVTTLNVPIKEESLTTLFDDNLHEALKKYMPAIYDSPYDQHEFIVDYSNEFKVTLKQYMDPVRLEEYILNLLRKIGSVTITFLRGFESNQSWIIQKA